MHDPRLSLLRDSNPLHPVQRCCHSSHCWWRRIVHSV